MRIFLVICLITVFNTPLSAFGSDSQQTNLSEDWIIRAASEAPSTDEEKLAVLAASEHRDINKQNVEAKYDGIYENYETVTVRTLPEPDSPVQKITKYRVLDKLICASTSPVYGASVLVEKQQNLEKEAARSIAINANGKNSERPLIVGDKAMGVVFYGKCDSIVTVKNFNREVVGTYRFKMCE